MCLIESHRVHRRLSCILYDVENTYKIVLEYFRWNILIGIVTSDALVPKTRPSAATMLKVIINMSS